MLKPMGSSALLAPGFERIISQWKERRILIVVENVSSCIRKKNIARPVLWLM